MHCNFLNTWLHSVKITLEVAEEGFITSLNLDSIILNSRITFESVSELTDSRIFENRFIFMLQN